MSALGHKESQAGYSLLKTLGLRAPGSFSQVRVRGLVQQESTISTFVALKPFTNVLKTFPMPKGSSADGPPSRIASGSLADFLSHLPSAAIHQLAYASAAVRLAFEFPEFGRLAFLPLGYTAFSIDSGSTTREALSRAVYSKFPRQRVSHRGRGDASPKEARLF